MKSFIRNCYISLFDIASERTPYAVASDDHIEQWRRKFFLNIIVILSSLSIFVYIPSIFAALMDNLINIAIVNTVAFLVVQLLFFVKGISLQNKKLILITLLFGVGISLVVSLGFEGSGLIYLTAVSVIATLLYKPSFGYFTIGTNSIAMLLTYYINFPTEWILQPAYPVNFPALITYITNYLLFNLVIVSAIASLLSTLSKKRHNEIKINKQLEKKNKDYKEAMNKARESDQLKSTFLNNMSHEVRTPLNGIIGFSQLMKEETNSGQLIEHCDQVIESGFQLLQIITDIIDASIITNNQVKIFNNEIEYISFININQNKWTAIQHNKNQELTIQFQNHINKKIKSFYADEEKLSKTIDHLINNAVKYTNKGFINVIFEWEEQNKNIRISVKDNGIGIAAENQQNIFNPFYQINESFNEGNGLGLFIVKGFVEKWGGTVSLTSNINTGSTFTFTLPIDI